VGKSIIKMAGIRRFIGREWLSSGLSRPDYFDWDLEGEKLISVHNPDIVVAIFGANDNQKLS